MQQPSQIKYGAANVTDPGIFYRHEYLGGSACINLYLENKTSMELVYWPEGSSLRQPSSWMVFAQYPNADVNCNGFSSLVEKASFYLFTHIAQ
jgi:hypothetical protein